VTSLAGAVKFVVDGDAGVAQEETVPAAAFLEDALPIDDPASTA